MVLFGGCYPDECSETDVSRIVKAGNDVLHVSITCRIWLLSKYFGYCVYDISGFFSSFSSQKHFQVSLTPSNLHLYSIKVRVAGDKDKRINKIHNTIGF